MRPPMLQQKSDCYFQHWCQTEGVYFLFEKKNCNGPWTGGLPQTSSLAVFLRVTFIHPQMEKVPFSFWGGKQKPEILVKEISWRRCAFAITRQLLRCCGGVSQFHHPKMKKWLLDPACFSFTDLHLHQSLSKDSIGISLWIEVWCSLLHSCAVPRVSVFSTAGRLLNCQV